MNSRLAKTLLATAAVAAMALPAGAQARQGADDPAGHVRHAVHTTVAGKPGADDSKSSATTKKRSATKSRDRNRRRHGRRHGVRRADDNSARRQARGTDDRTAGTRGGGVDDGPNHM